MFLAIDIGNTNIVAGVWHEEQWTQWRLSTARERTGDEMAAFLGFVFQARGLSFSQVQGVAISSVVPSLTPAAAGFEPRLFRLRAADCRSCR